MAGVHFGFDNFKQLLELNIGISERLDESRSESFTLLYCDFSTVSQEVIKSSLESVLRTSDSIVNSESDYFFVLPYTDKYGAEIVKNMFRDFFARELDSYMVSYPKDGEKPRQLLEELRDTVSTTYQNDLRCLDKFIQYR
ncbi:hypothetical protein HUE87_00165 [Candidatus Sulfurimonas marisnigri]|uniref:GGDEF domain-containing protein n=1 Tax=Candidatus Sulfurimonas marisnigri TaxID=2740405 RepID=A0A7S7M081_9BACT|nr:hypothetical protein [Candidatus Sulfurimonas marisnigri]QOY54700.1 hypothetical protein HUE87_00165 [Candidatus Sulfurimonas marisnigri]